MKKVYVLVAVVLASFGTFASTEGTIVSIENNIKEGVDVVISVTSDGAAVKGALVKIVAERMVIGAGTTDEGGNVSINIASYGGQMVSIEVFHNLYKSDKLNDTKLENGKTYSFILKSKGESVEEITEESEVRVVETQEEIEKEKQDAAEAVSRKEDAIKNQEQRRKEAEEAKKQAEEAIKEAEEAKKEVEAAKEQTEEIKKNSGSLSEEKAKQIEDDIKAREEIGRAHV